MLGVRSLSTLSFQPMQPSKLGDDFLRAPRIQLGLAFGFGATSALAGANRHYVEVHRRPHSAHFFMVNDRAIRAAKFFPGSIANMKSVEVAAQVFAPHQDFGSCILWPIDAALAAVRAAILKKVFSRQGPHCDRLPLFNGLRLVPAIYAGVANSGGNVQPAIRFVRQKIRPVAPSSVQAASVASWRIKTRSSEVSFSRKAGFCIAISMGLGKSRVTRKTVTQAAQPFR